MRRLGLVSCVVSTLLPNRSVFDASCTIWLGLRDDAGLVHSRGARFSTCWKILPGPEMLTPLVADAFYSPNFRVECTQVHLDVPVLGNTSRLQYFPPVLLEARFLVLMYIPKIVDTRERTRRDIRPQTRPA